MPNHRSSGILLLAVLMFVAGGAAAVETRSPCDDSLTRGIPARAADARGGRAFAEQIRGLSDDDRESQIRHELKIGNIPNFLRRLVPVRLEAPGFNGKLVEITICAAPDYLAIGSDDDFLLMPMRLATALSAAADYGFTLPTPRLVNAIYAQAAAHFAPQPLPAGDEMRSTEYSLLHNDLVAAQRSAIGSPLGSLIAGDKKDLVLTNRLRSHLNRVAIYGWQTPDGRPIQPLSTVHGWRYADYSHGARLISTHAFIDGEPRSIFEILEDNRLAAAVSDEGVVADVMGLISTLTSRTQATIAEVVPKLQARLP